MSKNKTNFQKHYRKLAEDEVIQDLDVLVIDQYHYILNRHEDGPDELVGLRDIWRLKNGQVSQKELSSIR